MSDSGVVVFTSADPFTTRALPFPPANVYLMALDGSNVRQVTHFIVPAQGVGSATIAAGATISASGDTIAFETFLAEKPEHKCLAVVVFGYTISLAMSAATRPRTR